MGAAYAVVTLLYAAAFTLSLNVGGEPGKGRASSVAFLVNLLAFPFFMGLLPYAARDVYDIGMPGLGWLAAAFASGALVGSLLVGAGFVQSLCLTPLAAVMLRASSDEMRGRVMGLRMLAIWGLPLGLLAAGPLISRLGFSTSTLIYASLGLAAVLAIGLRWRQALWRASAPANATV